VLLWDGENYLSDDVINVLTANSFSNP
jgi:hypothetical protein